MSKYLRDEEVNLIDLKDGGQQTTLDEDVTYEGDTYEDEEEKPLVLDFSQLKMVENPVEDSNENALPQTLHGCVGHLDDLPLLQPNADQSNPDTIVDMVNSFFPLPGSSGQESKRGLRDDDTAPLVTKKNTAHRHAFGAFAGHTVRPGCISMYKKYDIIYAVPEGRWWLLDPLASWVVKNVSLDKDLIQTDDNQVLIIRIIEGQVGLITIVRIRSRYSNDSFDKKSHSS